MYATSPCLTPASLADAHYAYLTPPVEVNQSLLVAMDQLRSARSNLQHALRSLDRQGIGEDLCTMSGVLGMFLGQLECVVVEDVEPAASPEKMEALLQEIADEPHERDAVDEAFRPVIR